jgi:hypothetical protein
VLRCGGTPDGADRPSGVVMRDPREILSQAGSGAAPPEWAVFTKQRGRVRGFFAGTSDDPDPILVVTPEGVAEYVDSRKPIDVVDFAELATVDLRVRGHSSSSSSIVTLQVWLDLGFLDGRRTKWRSASFGDDVHTVQAFLEAFGAHRILRRLR